MSDEWTTNTTDVIIKRYAERFTGDSLSDFATYLTKQRKCRDYSYWKQQIKERQSMLKSIIGDES